MTAPHDVVAPAPGEAWPRRERMILAVLARVGELELRFGTPAMAAAFAELEAQLAAIGEPPPSGGEIRALLTAEQARLDARLEREQAALAELTKLGRHAQAMGLGPEDRMGVVLARLGIGPGDSVPAPGPRLVKGGEGP